MDYLQMYKEAHEAGELDDLVYELKTDWQEGDMLIGKLIDIKEVHFEETKSTLSGYVLETDTGLIQTVLGAGVDLQGADKFVIGQIYAITYKGKKDISGGKTLNIFRVQLIKVKTESVKTEKQKKTDT